MYKINTHFYSLQFRGYPGVINRPLKKISKFDRQSLKAGCNYTLLCLFPTLIMNTYTVNKPLGHQKHWTMPWEKDVI